MSGGSRGRSRLNVGQSRTRRAVSTPASSEGTARSRFNTSCTKASAAPESGELAWLSWRKAARLRWQVSFTGNSRASSIASSLSRAPSLAPATSLSAPSTSAGITSAVSCTTRMLDQSRTSHRMAHVQAGEAPGEAAVSVASVFVGAVFDQQPCNPYLVLSPLVTRPHAPPPSVAHHLAAHGELNPDSKRHVFSRDREEEACGGKALRDRRLARKTLRRAHYPQLHAHSDLGALPQLSAVFQPQVQPDRA
eukprot:3480142-Rhodomonas_salina.2